MKKSRTFFEVNLSDEEVEIITDALAKACKEQEYFNKDKNVVRQLRNGMGGLLNRFFMGADA